MVIRHKFFIAMIFLSSLLGNAWGQNAKPTTLADLAQYTGPDRDAYFMRELKKKESFHGTRR